MLSILLAAFSATATQMNDCSDANRVSMPILDHGIHPEIPIRGEPLQRWIDFYISDEYYTPALHNATFRYSTVLGNKTIYSKDSELCDEIDCDGELGGYTVTFADYWDTKNVTPGITLKHIVEVFNDIGEQLLCSEAQFTVGANLAISAPKVDEL
jgi:hypothetical protein